MLAEIPEPQVLGKEGLGFVLQGRCVCALLCPTLCNPMDGTCQAPLSVGFSRQEY